MTSHYWQETAQHLLLGGGLGVALGIVVRPFVLWVRRGRRDG